MKKIVSLAVIGICMTASTARADQPPDTLPSATLPVVPNIQIDPPPQLNLQLPRLFQRNLFLAPAPMQARPQVLPQPQPGWIAKEFNRIRFYVIPVTGPQANPLIQH